MIAQRQVFGHCLLTDKDLPINKGGRRVAQPKGESLR
jgi:hypothetical protein